MESILKSELPTGLLEPYPQQRQGRSKKNTYKFYMGNNVHREVVISSNFDSGNVYLLRQVNYFFYRLAAVSDTGAQLARKTWFYFKVRAYRNCRLKLVVENVDVLSPAYYVLSNLYSGRYRAVDQSVVSARMAAGSSATVTSRYPNAAMQRREELELHIEHTFQSDYSVFFALSVPFSYEDNHNFLVEMEQQAETVPQCYFKKELLTYSFSKRMIHLVTITQRETANGLEGKYIKEYRFDSKLFPENDRAVRFDKPVILIASRVHPGEVASSHCLTGIIKFLLNPKDLRAYLLRRLFVFMVVPMLNPDGVWEGNYRMDLLNRNLNRLYNNPDFTTEPQVYGLRKLADYLSSESRMYLYLDMHGHSSTKPAFVYGNALEDIVNQVENQLFCRLLAQNTRYFSYEQSNFTEEQMTTKDRDEALSKEGCSRVCLGRLPSVMLSLTLEIGLHPVGRNFEQPAISNTDFTYDGLNYTERSRTPGIVQICEYIGEQTMVTLLDSVDKNPYSRLPNSTFKSLEGLRRAVAGQLLQEDYRFRRTDIKAYQKVRAIDKLAQEYFVDKLNLKWGYLAYDQKLCKFEWPTSGLKLLATLKPTLLRPFRREKSPKKKKSRHYAPTGKDQVQGGSNTEDYVSYLKELSGPMVLSNNLNSKTVLNPISIDFGIADSEQVSARTRRTGNNLEELAAELRKEGRLKQQEVSDRPLLIVREIELPKLIRNMITHSQDDRLIEKRKQSSNSPLKKRKDLLTDVPNFLVGTDKPNFVPIEREPQKKSRSKRKLSILESLRKVEEYAEEMFGNMNTKMLYPYNCDSSGALKRNNVRVRTEDNTDYILKSNKSTRRELVTTEPTLIDEIMQRENERYDRLMLAHQDVEEQRSRNIRYSRRELLNIKLRQFRKKGQQTQQEVQRKQPVLPSLRREESENEQFDDLAVRDHSREIKEQQEAMSNNEREVKLYISSRRVVAAKPVP